MTPEEFNQAIDAIESEAEAVSLKSFLKTRIEIIEIEIAFWRIRRQCNRMRKAYLSLQKPFEVLIKNMTPDEIKNALEGEAIFLKPTTK